VYGKADGPYGRGVRGSSTGSNGSGVIAFAGYSGTGNHAVHGSNTGYPNAYAGYFNGKVHISGPLSKPGGSFLIDRPADPENMTLRHSFVESPEMLLVYKGRAQQHRFPVEGPKTRDGEFKIGEYLNPEAFGIEVEPPEEVGRPPRSSGPVSPGPGSGL
jgi:hypothetical protein